MKGVALHAKYEWFFTLREITADRKRAWYFTDIGTQQS